MIAIIGANGSMGKRYAAILDWMGHKYRAFDLETPFEKIIDACRAVDHVIIATPTHTHAKYLYELLPLKKNVLCEKPITKDVDELRELYAFCDRNAYSFSMMMQYSALVTNFQPNMPTHYKYFRHGPDGLTWDCLQIIGLARGPIELDGTSPIWDCVINGQKLSIADMDRAYVRFLSQWLYGGLTQKPDDVIAMHEKTAKLARGDDYDRAD